MEPFLAARSELIGTGEPGLTSARELCRLTDDAVRELARTASFHPPGRWAIVALGGWGAGTLLPHSDLDILVLSEAPAAELKPFVESVLYPLWDSGLKVGHQVRSPKSQSRAIREDLVTCTAALTARPLAGDTDWAAAAISGWARDASRRGRKLALELGRRERPGSPYLLEPDLKYGAGGRRDHDEIVWRASIYEGNANADIEGLVGAGWMTPEEAESLRDAAGIVVAARWWLQREGHGDRMPIDAAGDLPVGADAVQLALARTALALEHVRLRTAGTAVASGAAAPDEVLEHLAAGHGALEAPAQGGRLDHLISGFSELMTLRRPGLGHDLTVGAHSIRTAELVVSPGTTSGALSASLRVIENRLPLVVAALAHDSGKVSEPASHAEAGAPIARQAAIRFGLDGITADEVASLVRLHLLLAETATTADLDDEDTMLNAAAAIGDRKLLPPLHVLTAADTKATGASLWTSWLDSLLGTLVARLDLALSPDVDGAGIAARAAAVREATLSALPETRADERRFVSAAPLRYLAFREPASIAADAKLVAGLASTRAADAARVAVAPGPVHESAVVTIAAPDSHALFSRLAGACALAGLDILSADAYPAPDGLALDVFTVVSATRAPMEPETFATLERLVRAALRDRLQLATRLKERRRHYPPRSAARVRVQTEHTGWGTTLKVQAPDRVGLLHDIGRAVADEGLDIRWARAVTVDGVATDTFTVVGPDGAAVGDDGVLGHLAMRIREAASIRM